jgi:hypothetical protein
LTHLSAKLHLYSLFFWEPWRISLGCRAVSKNLAARPPFFLTALIHLLCLTFNVFSIEFAHEDAQKQQITQK